VGLGFILTVAWKELPFLALVAGSVLARRGGVLEEASRSLGAGPLQTFTRVTVPVLLRGLLPAVVAVFTFVAGSYEVAALLAPSDPLALPLQILERSRDPALELRGDAFVLALLALAIGAAAVVAHEAVRARWGALDG
jgi:ABC-type spermidine/putrescine transport system permease subunit I